MSSVARNDPFPEPTSSKFDRGTSSSSSTDLAPYRDPETGRAPQAEYLAGPPGMADIETDARNHVFVSGLGSGKTAGLILRSWVNAEHWSPGELHMLVAPTGPAIKNVILPEMRSMGLLDVCEYHGPGSERPGIITPSGARIILESADNARKIDRLRGPNLASVGMDEAASIEERAYEVLSGRLRAGNYRNFYASTTPKGRNWIHRRFYDLEDVIHRYDGAYEWIETESVNGVFGVPSRMNPYNPDDYLERLRADYSGSFYRQEVQGAFVQFEGLIYPWFSKDEHVIGDDELPESFDEIVYGLDWGHNNPAAIVPWLREGDRWTAPEEFVESRCTVGDLAEQLAGMFDRFAPSVIFCDPSEPASIEELRRKGLPAKPAKNAVSPGIQYVQSLRDQLRVHSSCMNLRNEFNQYQYKEGKADDKPLKENDHAMDATRYALFSRHRSRQSSGTAESEDTAGGVSYV